MPPLAVILPAAGSSARFGRDKLAEPLGGVPVLARTLLAVLGHPAVAQVVVATPDELRTRGILRAGGGPLDGRVTFAPGGATRAHSVWNAARAVRADVEWVAVHDAARPLMSAGLIDRTLATAVTHDGAAAPALPVGLTVKRATGPLPAAVRETVPRHDLWAMQTPQIARRTALLDAFDRCPLPLEQVTDDVQLIELAGGAVWLVPGEERNLKITTATDLRLAELLLGT